MRRLKELIPPAVGREEVLRLALAQKALRHWPEIVGPALALRSSPDRYEKGTVWIAVEGSAWAQELRLAKPHILSRLREAAEMPGLFADLRFGVRPFTIDEIEKDAPPRPQRPTDPRSIREIAEARMKHWNGL